MSEKAEMTQSEFDELYTITDKKETPKEKSTEPEFLTEEEQKFDTSLKETLGWKEEETE